MTKFKLRKMAVAGVMALGIAAIVPAVNASAEEVWSGKNSSGVQFDVNYYGSSDTLSIQSSDPIFYTDTKNAKTKLPSADKWLRAEYSDGDYWEIDLSSYSKETVIYIANSTSAKSENILAVTIPAKSTLKVKLDNATAATSGAFKFTTTSTKTEANGTDKFKYTLDKNAVVSASDGDVWERLQVKKSVASHWESIEEFFDNDFGTTLSKLQNKGTTLQFRLRANSGILQEMKADELVASKAIATKGAIESPEVPRYNILSSSMTTAAGKVIKALSTRASDIATVKIAKKANAPATVIDYDYFLATINKGSYVTLTEQQFNGSDSNGKVELPTNWTDANKTAITLTQGSFNYIAVKTKEDTGKKKPESNIAYLKLGEQDIFVTDNSEADENNDLVIVSSTFDSTGNVKGAELYIKGMQGETYQYCFGKASEILNGNQFVADKTKVKWSKLVNNAAKGKAPVVAAKTATIKDLKGADTILVRKASDKNKGQFASEYIIFTKDGNGWKKSKQKDPSTFTNQIVISTPSAVTYDANSITCELSVKNGVTANIDKNIEAKCGKKTVTGSAVASNDKLIVTIPRQKDSGLDKENDKLTFTLTIEAGAISDANHLASNKSVNKIVLDTRKPKVTGAKASAKTKKITINFDQEIKIENGAVKAVVVPGTPAAVAQNLGSNKKSIEITGQTFAKDDEIKVDLDFTKITDVSGNQASYDASKVTIDSASPSAITIKAVK